MKAPTYRVTIYLAGTLPDIEAVCRRFCLRGLCVTVTPTIYLFTGGQESGAMIGLINYPRFPKEPAEIRLLARALAIDLMNHCCQRSCTVETPEESELLVNEAISAPR